MNNSLAIMQPYLFPCIGYFHLLRAVDRFVVFDDVNFMTKGWVRRNYLIQRSGDKQLFTLPVEKASQNVTIRELRLFNYVQWREKFLKTLHVEYRSAPNFQQAYHLVEKILDHESEYLTDFLVHALRRLCQFLDIPVSICPSSDIYENRTLKGQDRIIDICKQEGANSYVNLSGGRPLYSAQEFEKNDISLFFVESQFSHYKQYKPAFIPSLSIIDVLMFNRIDELQILLDQYALVENEVFANVG